MEKFKFALIFNLLIFLFILLILLTYFPLVFFNFSPKNIFSHVIFPEFSFGYSDIFIQQAIDSTPPQGGTIFIKAGVHTLNSGLHINRSNITLIGEKGTVLKLGKNVNQPVILIGSSKKFPTQHDLVENIELANIEIDGNRFQQNYIFAEFDPDRCSENTSINSNNCWIRNNGIDVRMVHNLIIKNVSVHDTLSGGLVVSWDCNKIFISSCSFNQNNFDGIGLYGSQNIFVSDFLCGNNGKAGLSLDNKIQNVSFNNGIINESGDVGIFLRNAKQIHFSNISVIKSNSHGCFISHDTPGNDTGSKRIRFANCSFFDNNGLGLFLSSTINDSFQIFISGSVFLGNRLGCSKCVEGGQIHSTSILCSP